MIFWKLQSLSSSAKNTSRIPTISYYEFFRSDKDYISRTTSAITNFIVSWIWSLIFPPYGSEFFLSVFALDGLVDFLESFWEGLQILSLTIQFRIF